MKLKPTFLKTGVTILVLAGVFFFQMLMLNCDLGNCYRIPIVTSIVIAGIVYIAWSSFELEN